MKTALIILLILGCAISSFASGTAETIREKLAPVNEDVRIDLIEHAIYAQNAHNMQTWKIDLHETDSTRMTLYLNEKRLLPETDPYSRQITISAGNFLAVMKERAREIGYETEIVLFPEGEFAWDATPEVIGATSVAVIAVHKTNEKKQSHLLDAITQATVKRQLGTYRFSEGELKTLLAYNSDKKIQIFVVQDPEEVALLRHILIDAMRIEMEHIPTLMESYDNTRINRKQRQEKPYGLSYPGMFPVGLMGFMEFFSTLFPLKPEAYARIGMKAFEKTLNQIESYIFFVTMDNTRTTQVETGMVLQYLWMEVQNSGLSLLPASQPIQEYPEMAEYYQQMHDMYADEGETIQMILAVGEVIKRFKHSPRLRPEDIIMQ